MGGDRRRDRQKSEVRSRSSFERRDAVPPAVGDDPKGEEFDAPTRPRGRTLLDSEAPADPHASLNVPALRTTQDSFHPVRVPARSTRPPLSLWKRAWATVALVIVVAGGAIGIVASLRAHTLGTGERGVASDGSRLAGAAGSAEHGGDIGEPAAHAGMPAAAAGFTAPPPLAPLQGASHGTASSIAAFPGAPIASLASAVPAPASPRIVAFQTPESLAVAAPLAPASGVPLALSKRTKPAEPALPALAVPLPSNESANAPTPAPATSDAPETQGASEAWVTEERRF
jgi:hypothetical protein